MKPKGIRAGERVRVVNPEFFVRCGYPLDLKAETERIDREKEKDIRDFLASQGINTAGTVWDGRHKAINKVAAILAYELCRQGKWGGRRRSIHTKRFDEFAGAEFAVSGVRFVKTGEYTPGGDRGTYDGYEYEPPYLSNEKTHRLLETDCYGILPGGAWPERLEIEAANVEPVPVEVFA